MLGLATIGVGGQVRSCRASGWEIAGIRPVVGGQQGARQGALDAGAGALLLLGVGEDAHAAGEDEQAAPKFRGETELAVDDGGGDRKSTRLNSSHANISYAVFCLKKN